MFSGLAREVEGLEVTFGTLTPVVGRLMEEKFGFPRSMVKLEEKLDVNPGEENLDWKVDEKSDEKVDEKVDEKGPFGVVFGNSAERLDRSTDRSSLESDGRGMFSRVTRGI
ncbi:hypothetical protein VMCG_00289 [Cytospora schulzeri]|uniref:Uncharacterized protein n=1 Tax=Cytospora schulzeri TaxID=448051 RepID=A0A423X8L9_9PEZI|nr:hypothetical protein VMCG_00289 [Valsa malicola]